MTRGMHTTVLIGKQATAACLPGHIPWGWGRAPEGEPATPEDETGSGIRRPARSPFPPPPSPHPV